ncbi:hypothetical protein HPB48_026187 [Haemaphysalis longicornis]|uniref:Uncharacterized protein n=1 Tax=Haemaphysalis longicornis TaxID=44386 RepID=A0A9J6HAT7_HAELO|nr:hypothetical protein HPB48_026187 [Haemaphysalis longicornis]
MASTRNGSNGTAPIRFIIHIDLEVLAYVRNLNPFKDPMEWTGMASKMEELLQPPFTARAVRDRAVLLLEQYASADRTNLRR